MDLGKGNDILTLEALAGSYALLVGRLESPFSQMLDEGDEDILWVVLFEGDIRVGAALGLFSLRGWWVLRVVLVASELGAHLCELSHRVHAVT